MKLTSFKVVKFSLYGDVNDVTGNVDTVGRTALLRTDVLPQIGFAYCADAVGHNYLAKGQKNKVFLIYFEKDEIDQIWKTFQESLPGMVPQTPLVDAIEQKLQVMLLTCRRFILPLRTSASPARSLA